MYILKRSGPNTDPWGTLCLTVSPIQAKIVCIERFQYYSLFSIYSVRFKPVWGFTMDIITFQCV